MSSLHLESNCYLYWIIYALDNIVLQGSVHTEVRYKDKISCSYFPPKQCSFDVLSENIPSLHFKIKVVGHFSQLAISPRSPLESYLCQKRAMLLIFSLFPRRRLQDMKNRWHMRMPAQFVEYLYCITSISLVCGKISIQDNCLQTYSDFVEYSLSEHCV